MTYSGRNESFALMQLITSSPVNWAVSVTQIVFWSDHWPWKIHPLVLNNHSWLFSCMADLLFYWERLPVIQVCNYIPSRKLFLEFEEYLEELACKQMFHIYMNICIYIYICSVFILFSALGGIVLGNGTVSDVWGLG